MKSTLSETYENDFYAWAMENAALVRQGRFAEADIEHIASELESMGASERRELSSRLQVLIMHLLKYQLQPEHRTKSWLLTIFHQRTAIRMLLDQSPSLRRSLSAGELDQVFAKAVKEAMIETELDRHLFPAVCPYTLAQLLDEDYLPL